MRLTYSNVMSTVAVFVALGGTSYAALTVTGKNVKNASLTGKDMKDASLTSADVKNGSLQTRDLKTGVLSGGGGDGRPGQDATSPAGAVMFFDLASCPAGWSEFTEARGRYVVGLPDGGTLKGVSGTALSNVESRPVGQHNHAGEFNHTHPSTVITVAGGSTIGVQYAVGSGGFIQSGGVSGGVLQIANAGSVAGTNAPYVQLRACEKS